MRNTRFAIAVCLAMLMIYPVAMVGQHVFGTISGTVTDSSGAAVPNATVKVSNVGTGVVRTFHTNDAGIYTAPSLSPGTYKIEASAPGFKATIISAVTLEVDANPRVDLALQVGAVTESVEVSAQAPLLDVQQSDLGQTLSQRQIQELPTLDRNLYTLLPLSAGVAQQGGCDGCGNNGNLRINGDRPRNQDYLLDGTTINAPVFGGQSVNPSLDSIQEFRVETNSMSAEYGKAGGGLMIAVSKSGTNEFHGSAYIYNRNQYFNARNYFDNDSTKPKNPFRRNDFGGTIGGPIVKNKLFFFVDYQGIRQNNHYPVQAAVPNNAFRGGDLSALCTTFDASGMCTEGQQITDPAGTPIPFNRIPTSQINPISQNFLEIWPISSTPLDIGTSLLSYTGSENSTTNRFNPRVDFEASARDHIFGALHSQWYSGFWQGLIPGKLGRAGGRHYNHALTAGWSHSVSSASLNEVRFGYFNTVGGSPGYGAGIVNPSDFGLQGIPACLASVPGQGGGTKCGMPMVNIAGYAGIGGTSMYEPASTMQINDTLSRQIGRHSVKFGGETRRYSIDNYQPDMGPGSFHFGDSLATGNAFSDFLFGVLDQSSGWDDQNAMLSTRAWSYALFFQDDFRLTPKLTLNLGLRWEYNQSFTETHNGLAFFNPYTAQWEQFGVNAPKTTFDPSRKQFGPRLGFAWNPTPSFVVRGGYGITYPGTTGHGRAGDGQPGPNLKMATHFEAGTNWSNLPTITVPDPSAITAPLPVNSNVSWSYWAPRKQTPTYIQNWNLTLQKQLSASTVAQLSYVGSHGVHLPINSGYNLCQQSPESTIQFGWDATSTPYCPLAAEAVQAGGGSLGDLYVNPGYWGLSSSIYHSLQAKVERRFARGFSLLANFTWSKLIDDSSSDWGGFWSLDLNGQDFYNRGSERSVSAGDIPVRLTIAPIFELPFGPGHKWLPRGIASQVLGGWRISTIYTVSSGTPIGIYDGCWGYCSPAHMISTRPMMVGNPLPSGFDQTIQHWFDPNAFDFGGLFDGDPAKAFGNAPRYFSNVRSPGVNNLDLSVQKDFRIPVREQMRLQFRADFFNLPNHPQFGEPIADPFNPQFGQVTRTAQSLPNRMAQLGLHLRF